MKTKFESDSSQFYIRVSGNGVSRSKPIVTSKETVVIDFDDEGCIAGIEIVNRNSIEVEVD